jgi:hypothetical protein
MDERAAHRYYSIEHHLIGGDHASVRTAKKRLTGINVMNTYRLDVPGRQVHKAPILRCREIVYESVICLSI